MIIHSFYSRELFSSCNNAGISVFILILIWWFRKFCKHYQLKCTLFVLQAWLYYTKYTCMLSSMIYIDLLGLLEYIEKAYQQAQNYWLLMGIYAQSYTSLGFKLLLVWDLFCFLVVQFVCLSLCI